MNKLELLKAKLEMVELEERLEMVQIIATEAAATGENSCCCGSNGDCKPATKTA